MLQPGRVIDRYEVIALLGEGGMATVYRVRHTALGSQHALKVLHPTTAGVRERLLAEGRVQAGLDHPFALTVTVVIDVEGSPGLVMELVEGGTLLDWLDGAPSREERLRVFRQVCEAVGAAHAQGWIHRDLKPINILMKGAGPHALPKVADFGLVKAVVGSGTRPGPRTRDGVAMGTPGYMAPEQIADAAGVDARADVYSLGCVLVILITGEPAFDGEVLDVFAAVAAGAHRKLPEDDPLHGLVERCLARDPDDRPSDARALLAELDAARVAKPAPPRPRARTAGVSATAAAIGGVIGMLGMGCLCGGLVLTWALPDRERGGGRAATSGATTDCPLNGTKRLGYARVPSSTLELGDRFVLPAEVEVLARAKDADSGLCRLPAGAEVHVRERARSGRSERDHVWLAIYGDNVTLP